MSNYQLIILEIQTEPCFFEAQQNPNRIFENWTKSKWKHSKHC